MFKFPNLITIDDILITTDNEGNIRVFIQPEENSWNAGDLLHILEEEWNAGDLLHILEEERLKERWENFVEEKKDQGYVPMSVNESNSWIKKPPSPRNVVGSGSVILIPLKPEHIPFASEYRFGLWFPDFFLSKDYEGNVRVFKKKP